jgi:hypothetical protein
VRAFDTDPAGHRHLLELLESFGPVDRIGVEGTGTCAVGLTRFLHRNQIMAR